MQIILNLIQAIVLLITLVVIVSYIIRKYELENRKSEAASTARRTTVAETVVGIAQEILAVLVSLVLYPFGWIAAGSAFARLRYGERPVVLCHGYMHNRSAFFLLGYRLRRAGRNNVVVPNFRPASASIPVFAERLAEVVDSALSQTGCDKVDLVGHSMGGLVVRYYVENLGGVACVRTAVTLGAPNRGTTMAVLGVFQTARQFRTDAPFIAELDRLPASHDSVRMVSIWSDFDNVVIPPENAKLPEPCENIVVHDVGHLALLFSGRVFARLRQVLSEEPTR